MEPEFIILKTFKYYRPKDKNYLYNTLYFVHCIYIYCIFFIIDIDPPFCDVKGKKGINKIEKRQSLFTTSSNTHKTSDDKNGCL